MWQSAAALEQQILSTNSNKLIQFETWKFVEKEAIINVQVTTPSKCQFINKECFYRKENVDNIKVC